MNEARLVDAHVHARGRYAPLADAWPLLNAAGVTHVVLVQEFDRRDNVELLAESRDDRVLGVIVGIALDDERASKLAADLLAHPKVRGIRLPRTGSWATPADSQLWPALDEHAAVISVPPIIDRVAGGEVSRIAAAYPRVRLRIEHVAGTPFGQIGTDDDLFRKVLALSDHANVCMTWSGFFHNAPSGFPYREAHPHLQASFRAFGAERISWSGDVNRLALTAHEYAEERRLLDQFGWLAAAERRRIFANTP